MHPFFSINQYFEKIVPRGGRCQEGGCERKKITLLFTIELAHYKWTRRSCVTCILYFLY